MENLYVKTRKPYEIIIEKGIIKNLAEHIDNVFIGKKIMIVTDNNILPLYAEQLKNSLITTGHETEIFAFPAGETSKTMSTVVEILHACADFDLSRTDMIIGIGGGVVGDLAGFAASIYMRGIKYISIPTTLLASIDSSVGGKTGCDLPQGKNLAGTFHQPSLVLIDPDVLNTLPKRYINDGMAEAIKHAALFCSELFSQIASDNINYTDLIYKNINFKKRIIEDDEFEGGDRKLLNFGHTLGHAIEKYGNYSALTHGEAIGVGMMLVTRASEKAGYTLKGTSEQLDKILKKFDLPTETDYPLHELLDICKADKKRRGDVIDFVFIREIGKGNIMPLKLNELNDFFN